jgi:hypothetical protein
MSIGVSDTKPAAASAEAVLLVRNAKSVSHDVLALQAIASQTGKSINVYDSAGTTSVFSVAADGGVSSAGAVSFSGAVSCLDSFKPEAVTADPCKATGYGVGSMFYNATSNYMCFCDGSTDDIKMNDNSTACF